MDYELVLVKPSDPVAINLLIARLKLNYRIERVDVVGDTAMYLMSKVIENG